ncbi:monosaccharide-sensing protein 2-like [Prunus yedoensis var. nudiflora]|uniref:Monosaccharide-sensing protein 2-like n=1 Tax=Prunus yedoensis var. nudiflora TaxID=2094558 RepID=A0A314ZEJ9_PRUYE|nr:monosaccharide-sensing protein 2-like [Prunus yedoensis var. nudiflora]
MAGKMFQVPKLVLLLFPFPSCELTLLVEGFSTGRETTLEEYIISPANLLANNQATTEEKDQMRLYGPEESLSYIAKPVTGQSLTSHHGSAANQSIPLMDPLVTLFGSVHEKLSERGSKGSMYYPNLGSILNAGEYHNKNDHWDMESQTDGEDHESETPRVYCDDTLRSPLISRQTMSMDKDVSTPRSGGSVLGVRCNTILMQGEDGKKEGGYQRVYLHQESGLGSQPASVVSIGVRQETELIQAAGLVSQPAVSAKDPTSLRSVGPEMVPTSEAAVKGPKWRDLLEPGVKRALIVGIGLQILQQVAGINGVLYYTPQVYEQAG